MSSKIKPLSPSNPFYLPPEIYRHAVMFCRCYPRWKHAHAATASISGVNYDGMPHGTTPGNPTEAAVMAAYRNYAPYKCKLIEDTVRAVGEPVYRWLLVGVTEDVSVMYLQQRLGMPCGKNQFLQMRQEVYYRIAQLI